MEEEEEEEEEERLYLHLETRERVQTNEQEEEEEEEFFNHYKNDLERHAHTPSGVASADANIPYSKVLKGKVLRCSKNSPKPVSN